MNVEIGAEAAQFPANEYINGIAVVAVRGLFGVGFKGFQKCWKFKGMNETFCLTSRLCAQKYNYTHTRHRGEKGRRETERVSLCSLLENPPPWWLLRIHHVVRHVLAAPRVTKLQKQVEGSTIFYYNPPSPPPPHPLWSHVMVRLGRRRYVDPRAPYCTTHCPF